MVTSATRFCRSATELAFRQGGDSKTTRVRFVRALSIEMERLALPRLKQKKGD
jgi:hypothetical protein